MTDALFSASGLSIRPVCRGDYAATLEVYRDCEDFLSFGPVATASMPMVLEDIKHSQQMKGVFCCIVDAADRHVGVLDFVPEIRPKTACLALLMIGKRSRNLGYGAAVVKELEAYLKRNYGTEFIESGVQVNNPDGIGFWRKMGFSIGTEARAMGDGTVAYEMQRKVE